MQGKIPQQMHKGSCVTLEMVESSIASEHYFTAADGVEGADLRRRLREAEDAFTVDPLWVRKISRLAPLQLLTFCVLVLKNGYTVVGKSACADPDSFDPKFGQRLAREDAMRQLWSLLAYELKSQLYRENEAMEKPSKVNPNYVFPQDIAQRADRAGCGAAPAASSTEGATGQASGKKETNYSVYDPFSVQGIIK